MKIESLNPKDVNVVFITIDSCRYDTVEKASTPFLKGLGELACAYTPGNYTVPAHHAFFVGHLPNVFGSAQPYYSEANGQLWRIKTGAGKDSGAWTILQGANIIEGYRNLGFYVLGAGGVTQFNDGSQLRKYFGPDFLYRGTSLDEEPCASRSKECFPLLHCEEIVSKLKPHKKWFLFVNCPETHFPYDTGDGLEEGKLEILRSIWPHFNLRESDARIHNVAPDIFHQMQIEAIEAADTRIATLFAMLPRERPILAVVCGDHGEMFGEVFEGKHRFGHIISSLEVLKVPLVIGCC